MLVYRLKKGRVLFLLGCLDTWASVLFLLWQDSLVVRAIGATIAFLWFRFFFWTLRTLPPEPWEDLEERMKR